MPSELNQAITRLRAKIKKQNTARARIRAGEESYGRRRGKTSLLSGGRKSRAKNKQNTPEPIGTFGDVPGQARSEEGGDKL